MALKYSTINHDYRKENDLSCNEYVLCDMIYFLSRHPNSKHVGWCYMSRQRMGDEMSVSKVATIGMISRMEEKGFLFKDPDTKFLQTHAKWNKCYGLPDLDDSVKKVNHQSVKKVNHQSVKKVNHQSVKKLNRTGKESLPIIGKESLPNNIYFNNNNDIKQISPKKSFDEREEEKHNDVFRSMYSSRRWIELLAMRWKKRSIDVQKHVDTFRLECIHKGDFKKSEKDAKSHFVSWTDKVSPIKTVTENKNFQGF